MNRNVSDFTVIIPARYSSTRLPGKPLLQIGGKTLIEHVCERAAQSRAIKIIVATDDERIFRHVRELGFESVMTSKRCLTGTDRIAEVVTELQFSDSSVIVNLQGDEPFTPAVVIEQVAGALLKSPDASMSTGCEVIQDENDKSNPDVVKVVRDVNNFALYFSRSQIPYDRDKEVNMEIFKHIGIYAYRAGYIKRFASLRPCRLEKIEKLEQLRALWHGDRIVVTEITQQAGIGVDTQADLEMARRIYAQKTP